MMWPTTKTFDWYVEQRRSLATGVRRLITLIAANRKLAAGVAIGVVVILTLIPGYFAWSSRQEVAAAALLFKAVSQLASDTGTAEDVKNQEDGVRMLRELTTRYPRTTARSEERRVGKECRL